MAACAPVGERFQQDCRRCRHDPELRRMWGCDEPTEQEQCGTSCPVCQGEDERCPECKGLNHCPVFRCPNVLIKPEHFEAIRAVLRMEVGVLPDEGGWADQPATLVAATPLLQSEIEHWRERHRAIAEAKAKARAAQQARHGR